ncbi:MAG TPA: hypothetical protein VJ385_05490 [Fibrobacteria bacterium]|nr:hypothetical protein [Fibrobacteria bacterium]
MDANRSARAGIACIAALSTLAGLPGAAFALQSADLSGIALFPADNPWHYDVSKFPVHPNSANLVASVGNGTSLHPDFGSVYQGAPFGIPYIVVDKNQARIPIHFTAYGDESDPGPYPIPLTAPIEGGNPDKGDRHVLAVDKDAKILYELFVAQPKAGQWDAACGAKFDLASNALRPDTWTSADAAGLPILPGLVRYDEIARGVIDHAIRMTVETSRKSYVWPARHQAGSSTSANDPPMGQRYRLKAGFDTSGYPRAARIVLTALKKYGLIVADNGGDWFLSGAPDDRMPDGEIDALKRVKGSDFEAVQSVDGSGNPITPGSGILLPLGAPRTAAGYGGPAYDLLGRLLAGEAGMAAIRVSPGRPIRPGTDPGTAP